LFWAVPTDVKRKEDQIIDSLHVSQPPQKHQKLCDLPGMNTGCQLSCMSQANTTWQMSSQCCNRCRAGRTSQPRKNSRGETCIPRKHQHRHDCGISQTIDGCREDALFRSWFMMLSGDWFGWFQNAEFSCKAISKRLPLVDATKSLNQHRTWPPE
jgi:hypothetical protein